MMRTVLILFVLLFFGCATGFSQKNDSVPKVRHDTLSTDSLEFELIILDPGFDTWLITKPGKEYYSQKYYEFYNKLYVSEWNYRYTSARGHGEYDSYIDYNPDTDYGLDLNYTLYYYFKYFEEKHNTKLYPSVR